MFTERKKSRKKVGKKSKKSKFQRSIIVVLRVFVLLEDIASPNVPFFVKICFIIWFLQKNCKNLQKNKWFTYVQNVKKKPIFFALLNLKL